MLTDVERSLAAVTEDRRASYLFDTKAASEAVRCVPNKFGDWWSRTEWKLTELAKRDPAAVAAHFAMILARAAEQARRDSTART
jgi:hypothetical protein